MYHEDVETETNSLENSISFEADENWIDGDEYGHIIHGEEWDEVSSVSDCEEECHIELSGSSDEDDHDEQTVVASRIHVTYRTVNHHELLNKRIS